jgi:hypothetical protein
MPLIIGVRAMRSLHTSAPRIRLMPMLALWVSLAVGVPVAMAQTPPELWSIQLHGGLFAPIEASGTSPTVGMRYSKHFGSHIQGGLLTGLTVKSKSLEAPDNGLPGSESQVELARVDAHLVPLMGFMQVNLTERFWLVPFVGIGGGYEWLNLNAKDHRTGLESSATYGNVAWETYAGVGLRLTSKVRVNGELFYNGGSLERRVLDTSGREWREGVDMNGVGARVGLDMVFE